MRRVLQGLLVALAGRAPRRAARRAAFLALALVLLFGLALRPVLVRGHSMEPTIRDGAWRIASRWWFAFQREPERSDVVLIRRVGGRMFYLKRVLGLPGETVQFVSGRLMINGSPHVEDYRSPASDWSMPPVLLGPDEFFVAGDNRSMDFAEHAAGKVERRHLAGKLIWP